MEPTPVRDVRADDQRTREANDQKTSQDLVKSTIALFLSFALGLKTEALKSALTPSTTASPLLFLGNPDVLLTLVFFFTWFSFFLGTNFYMRQSPADRSAWRFDLTATMVTLLIVVFLGAIARNETRSWFVGLLSGLYFFEFAWDLVHLRLQPKVPCFWYPADPLLAVFSLLFLFLPSLPLWLLAAGHLVYAVLNLYKLTEI